MPLPIVPITLRARWPTASESSSASLRAALAGALMQPVSRAQAAAGARPSTGSAVTRSIELRLGGGGGGALYDARGRLQGPGAVVLPDPEPQPEGDPDPAPDPDTAATSADAQADAHRSPMKHSA